MYRACSNHPEYEPKAVLFSQALRERYVERIFSSAFDRDNLGG